MTEYMLLSAVLQSKFFSDQLFLRIFLSGHITMWFDMIKSSLEASYTTRPPGMVYKGGIQRKISNLYKTLF